jgi:ribonuclease E
MFSPVVQLRSGGYVVLNQTEALVSIDVNSGRATREHHIEDTALKTNLEAADEIARQLRLRDLAGLIVIDFIDMDEKRNNRSVERRLKDCLKHDRARIQVGRISHFGLLEMSRQRIRSSVLESSTEKCPHCGGSGHMRSVSSVSLQVLRALEDSLIKGATHNILVRTRAEVALYLLNHKRAHLRELEQRFRITITVDADPTVGALQPFVIDRGEQVHSVEAAKAIAAQPGSVAPVAEDEDADEVDAESDTGEEEEDEDVAEVAPHGEQAETGAADGGRKRRRRRRRGRRGGEGRDGETYAPDDGGMPTSARGEDHDAAPAREFAGSLPEAAETRGRAEDEHRGDGERGRRRRGRRGGRRNRRGRDGRPDSPYVEAAAGSEPELDRAVAALDTGPRQPESEPAASRMPDPAWAAPAQQPSEPPQLPEPETPRRRSTVREPAPFGGGDWMPPAPAPEPAPTAAPAAAEPSDAEQAGKPRRAGWWSRRIAGGG